MLSKNTGECILEAGEQNSTTERSYWSNNFDLIRLFAASQVMVGHAVAHMKLPFPVFAEYLLNAFPGVPIFFVVSYASGVGRLFSLM